MSEQLKKSYSLGGIKNSHDYRVKIPFAKNNLDMHDVEININDWNECCAKAIELFGLPGDKYSCRFTTQAIEFWFKDEKDAMVFELTCG